MRRADGRAFLLALAVAAGAIACDDGALSPAHKGMTLSNRTIGPLTDTTLGTNGQPLTVIVMNEAFEPVRGVVVNWSTSGGATVSAARVATDAGGESIVDFTYGPLAGAYTVQASLEGLTDSPLTLTLIATAGNPVALEKLSGDGLTVAAGGMVTHRVVAKDARGNATNGVTVLWATAAGGGSITPAQNITGGDGTAEATRTLGTEPGAQSVTATAPGVPGAPQVTFSTTTVAAGGAPATCNRTS